MNLTIKGTALVALGISALAASTAGYFIYRDVTQPPRALDPTGHLYGKPTVGDNRFLILEDLTRDYVESHKDAPSAMRSGKELAPLAFLNAELKTKGIKWRVREVHGMTADIYEIT